METPAGPGPSEAKNVDRRMSLGKYVKRMSSVFKREKSDKTSPSSTPAAASAPQLEQQQQQQQQQPAKEEGAKEDVAKEEAAPAASTATQTTAAPPVAPAPVPKQLDRNAMQQERARALFAKYGLTLESHEWIPTPAAMSPPAVQRVEKSIRMRVHRSCHRCGTLYGSEKVCSHCEHNRCKKCPRYPKRKTPEEKQKEKEHADKPKKKKLLTITTKSGNQLSYQTPKQRVRRTCHKCESAFVPPTATTCEQCQHVRCTKCPREPAKLSKWPTGYPGDAEADSDVEVEKQIEQFRRTWRKPRARVRWECEKCHSSFVAGSPQCPGCGHERCDKCTRSPVKKAKNDEQYDPQIVAAVEAKLRALGVDDNPPSSGPEAT